MAIFFAGITVIHLFKLTQRVAACPKPLERPLLVRCMFTALKMNMKTKPNDYRNLLRRYESYAPVYDRRWARYSQATLNKALEAIPADGSASLIDVACGTGLLIDKLRCERPQLSATGVDISPQMLEKARERIPSSPENGVSWRIGTAEDLPVESLSFDVLTCTNAFHLVQDAARALSEFHRVLRPGGTVVIVDWCLDFPIMRVRNAALAVADRQTRHVRHLNQMVDLLESAGFTVASRNRFRAGLWGLMCITGQRPSEPAVVRSAERLPSRADCEFSHR